MSLKVAESLVLTSTDSENGGSVSPLPQDDVLWALVAEKTDALVAAWDNDPAAGTPLAELILDVPGQYRRAVICELVKVDLEIRWSDTSKGQPLEYYLEAFPEIGAHGDIPVDLIYEEYQIRNAAGNPVTRDQIASRFPHQIIQFDRLAGTGQPTLDQLLPATRLIRESDVRVASEAKDCLKRFSEGDEVDDFDLLLLLGSGTFAQVFLARQKSLERLVALKIATDKSREPRTLAQLDHPNIVRVYDQRVLEQGAIFGFSTWNLSREERSRM